MEMSLGQNVQYEILNNGGQHPIVTIRVDSPRESPISSPREEQLPIMQHSEAQQQQSPNNLHNEPIDVNLPCDTTNVFYEYPIDNLVEKAVHQVPQSQPVTASTSVKDEEIIIIEKEDTPDRTSESS